MKQELGAKFGVGVLAVIALAGCGSAGEVAPEGAQVAKLVATSCAAMSRWKLVVGPGESVWTDGSKDEAGYPATIQSPQGAANEKPTVDGVLAQYSDCLEGQLSNGLTNMKASNFNGKHGCAYDADQALALKAKCQYEFGYHGRIDPDEACEARTQRDANGKPCKNHANPDLVSRMFAAKGFKCRPTNDHQTSADGKVTLICRARIADGDVLIRVAGGHVSAEDVDGSAVQSLTFEEPDMETMTLNPLPPRS